jgi:hypothetical protein
MTDLFLIAHKVHGEPAFDVAARMECPICKGDYDIDRDEENICHECDDLGYWWIIPTSGHRAFPYCTMLLDSLCINIGTWDPFTRWVGGMPVGIPDHYPTSASPSRPKLDLTSLLAPANVKIQRRF